MGSYLAIDEGMILFEGQSNYLGISIAVDLAYPWG
ncbi:hypothetical protein S40285_08996 [Stachybotrys chlorohalonatus IBT 40285]|uniref:Uncharacterized protein n=1 Tax=Stachybotrys chlorohalonatus (strain IBT 40285) TaxID=1283841 RepID=A0A084QV68_STAC4|nr:hypothetical protein S40285_08996 [Stachybotrys chlorohalonata IBT 40285]